LKEHQIAANSVSYCGNTFQIVQHSGSYHLWNYHLWNISNGGVNCVLIATEAECKQWLVDHFTAIAAKDLSHLNLKFIFS